VAAGERLPEKVDVVIETVGEATWSHSLRALRPGGTVEAAGVTSGMNPVHTENAIRPGQDGRSRRTDLTAASADHPGGRQHRSRQP